MMIFNEIFLRMQQVQVTNAENERLSNLLNINLPCRCSVNPSLLHTDHSMVHLNFEVKKKYCISIWISGQVYSSSHFLEFKVEHLRRLNQDLEKQLKETLNSSREMQTKVSTLTTQNKHLEMELEDVDKVAQALKKQKDELVNTADKEMNDAKVYVVLQYNEIIFLLRIWCEFPCVAICRMRWRSYVQKSTG